MCTIARRRMNCSTSYTNHLNKWSHQNIMLLWDTTTDVVHVRRDSWLVGSHAYSAPTLSKRWVLQLWCHEWQMVCTMRPLICIKFHICLLDSMSVQGLCQCKYNSICSKRHPWIFSHNYCDALQIKSTCLISDHSTQESHSMTCTALLLLMVFESVAAVTKLGHALIRSPFLYLDIHTRRCSQPLITDRARG